MMVQLQRISGWHDIFVKLLEQGQPFATACANSRMPAERVFNEMGQNAEFKERVERAKLRGRGQDTQSGAIGETAGVVSVKHVSAGTIVAGHVPQRGR